MKKMMIRLAVCAMAVMTLSATTACSDKQDSKAPQAKQQSAKAKAGDLPNYRYVDLDTLLGKYNLAKDFNEELIRLQSSAEGTMKGHESKIQQLGTQMQNKMQNNGYLSEASYRADEQQLANMQQNAQQSYQKLQANIAQAMEKAQRTVNDSIQAFIKDYNKTRGYDAILYKNATLYINPDLDITSEVLEGLNARYNKVKK